MIELVKAIEKANTLSWPAEVAEADKRLFVREIGIKELVDKVKRYREDRAGYLREMITSDNSGKTNSERK